MKLKNLVLAIFLSFCFCKAKVIEMKTIKKMKINYYKVINHSDVNSKKIDSLELTEFDILQFDSTGNTVLKSNGNRYYPESSKEIFTYKKDTLYKETIYSYGKPYRETIYENYKNGLLKSKIAWYSKTKNKEKIEYFYYNHGKCSKEITYVNGELTGTLEYFYNRKLELIELKDNRIQSDYNSHYTFKYDSNGNNIEERSYKKDGKNYYMWINEFDNKKRKIKVSEGYNGNINIISSFFYDKYGNILKEVSSGEHEYIRENQYEYDSNGNWWKQKRIRNGNFEQQINREIIYY